MKSTLSQLRMIFADILRGYSLFEYKNRAYYIKHLTHFDATDMDFLRDRHRKKATKEGLLSEEEKMEELKKDDLWDDKKDAKIKELRFFAGNLRNSKSRLFLKKEREEIQGQIDSTEKELESILLEKLELIGMTTGSFADKKINEYYIYSSTFKTKELKERAFSEDEFDEMSSKELYSFIGAYNDRVESFQAENLKRIALAGFFLNIFYLSKDSPFIFYGKPVMELTFYQSELFTHGRYFKTILSEGKNRPPDEIMDDPDKIIEWYESSRNAQEAMDRVAKDSTGGSSIVGASAREMKEMGAIGDDEHVIDLAQEAAKKGGELNMQDLIKLHGQ
jgi:hypothetical protein